MGSADLFAQFGVNLRSAQKAIDRIFMQYKVTLLATDSDVGTTPGGLTHMVPEDLLNVSKEPYNPQVRVEITIDYDGKKSFDEMDKIKDGSLSNGKFLTTGSYGSDSSKE